MPMFKQQLRLASVVPNPESTSGSSGSMLAAPHADHQHPRLTATASGTLGATGEATITFTRQFASKPAVTVLYVETAAGQPVVFKIQSWLKPDGTAWASGSPYGGCVIKGYRSQTIPQNLVNLLLGAVFNLFGGSASGVEYSLIAVQPSQ